MKNIKEILERNKNHDNLLEIAMNQTKPDALSASHYRDTLKGIWWYNLANHSFLWSTKAKSHIDKEFPEIKNLDGWVRGRVFSDEGKNYIMIYSDDFEYGRIPGSVANDIYGKIESKFSEPIWDFVDQDGYSLLGD